MIRNNNPILVDTTRSENSHRRRVEKSTYVLASHAETLNYNWKLLAAHALLNVSSLLEKKTEK
jgi:hypothetical protein